MTTQHTVRLGATALLMSTISTLAYAQEIVPTLDPIYIESEQTVTQTANTYTFDPEALPVPTGLDGGALLSTIPGVSGRRMGAHGIDIIIRGMQKNQLNVIDAGGFTYGGCPSRMDPPTSIAAFYRADKVIVEKGYSSVTNGPGGSGGTVRLEREAPEFDRGQVFTGSLTTGVNSNGNGSGIAGTVSADLGNGFYAEFSGERKSSDDYEDGNSNEVRSGFTQKSAGVTFGYAKDGVDLALDIEKDRAEDVKFAGAQMDSPLSETMTYRLRGGLDVNAGRLTRIEGVLYSSNVDHTMDNYTLRTPASMKMLAPTTSDTVGGSLEGHLDFGTTTARIGVDYQANNRRALGYSSMGSMPINLANPSSLSWPDVTIAQLGVFGETETKLGAHSTLKLGLRYDHVTASADEADVGVGMSGTTANDYYQMVYGTDFSEDKTEDNFGGLIRYEYQLSSDTMVFAGLSRSVRTADANERAFSRGMNGVPSYVGNPDIDPEKHTQLDFGLETQTETYSLTATVFYDRVNDYILEESTPWPGAMRGVTTYRNIDAELAGVELSGSWNLGQVILAGDLSYTYGANKSDGGALGQIPPLKGSLSATYDADIWQAGARINWAAKQDRIYTVLDAGETPGYATVDLFGSYTLNDKVMLMAGIDNVFDKSYATHLNRSNSYDTSVERVNEPGRNIYLTMQVQF
nr:TonB-dependent receptor [uncultured Celeribacter sp.]